MIHPSPKPRPSKRSAKSRPKPVNAARRKREFARCFGSKARVEFVKSLPCCACGVVGYSENAHVENGGAGRKADYAKIVPLCGPRTSESGWLLEGCHRTLHRAGRKPFLVDLDALAAETERQWQSFVNRDAKLEQRQANHLDTRNLR